MSEKKEFNQSYILLYGFGLVFTLLLCLVGCTMLMIVSPVSSNIAENSTESKTIPIGVLQSLIMADNKPTPFLPLATLTPQTTPNSQVDATPIPTKKPKKKPTPDSSQFENLPDEIPLSASVSGIKGTPQLYTLDCEIQTAVDWARFFGTNINRHEFIDRLPLSDDPEEGFVGTINGPMGQLPPYDYGVHAPPVAELLRDYGIPAKAIRDGDFEMVKNEIASGRPVIVWIVNLPYDIITQEYTASNGNTTLVARYEHTWMITAYNMNVVTVIDSQWTYNVKISTFLERWAALGNQAIIYTPES